MAPKFIGNCGDLGQVEYYDADVDGTLAAMEADGDWWALNDEVRRRIDALYDSVEMVLTDPAERKERMDEKIDSIVTFTDADGSSFEAKILRVDEVRDNHSAANLVVVVGDISGRRDLKLYPVHSADFFRVLPH